MDKVVGSSRSTTSRRMSAAEPARVFAALGDPTRLSLLIRLSDGRTASISALTGGGALTRQAVTKHLRVLEDAGLVSRERSGRESRYVYRPQPVARCARLAGCGVAAMGRRARPAQGLRRGLVRGFRFGRLPAPARSNQASTSPDSLIVSGWPCRSTFLPSATRIQPSDIEYSSTSWRSCPLKRMPIPRYSASWSKCGLRGLIERWSGGVSLMPAPCLTPMPPANRKAARRLPSAPLPA